MKVMIAALAKFGSEAATSIMNWQTPGLSLLLKY